MGDEKAKAMYTLMRDSFDSESKRGMLIQEERERYLKGAAPGYTMEEVVKMALNKQMRPDEF